MSAFEIKSQVKLPLGKCMEVVLSGIQFRLFRASITMAIIALAVAFLMTIMGDSMIVREVAQSVESLIQPRQNNNFWVRRLSRPIDSADLTQVLFRARPDDARWNEYKQWGQASDEDLAALQALAADEARYLRFFAELKESQLRALTGRVRGRDIFRLLADEDALNAFMETLPNIDTAIPSTRQEFEDFLRRWEATRPVRARIVAGHEQALDGVRRLLDGQTTQEFLATLDEDKARDLQRLGYRMNPDDVRTLRVWAQRQIKTRHMEQSLQDPAVRQRFANQFGVQDLNRVTPDLFFGRMATRNGPDWLISALSETGRPTTLSADEIRETAEAWLNDRRLARLESSVQAMDITGGFMGFSNRVLWLIGVSLIVCVVGIANAMLMSVTERFKEIATMKCLGATDGFIMTNFIMESGIQGLSGGLIGGLLGLVLGIARASLGYGWMAFANLPILDLLLVFVFSVAAGIALSVLAAIYPALAAARLAPLEAMRVE